MADLTLKGITKHFGDYAVLHGIDLTVRSGELVVFVGPSGCGKSTLLRLIAGLDEITAGTFEIDGVRMNDVPAAQRGISMVFQSYALYPHMSVYENMAFGLRIAGQRRAEIDRRVRQAAEMLQLSAYLGRVPRALSGGQRQRVAIGRAIVRNPKVFLFDEPLSNLDAALRVATRVEIAKLKQGMPSTTMIYVTHDQVEAMTLADRIVVLREGRIEQVGTPMELYRTPKSLFVARFIGSPSMNVVPATALAGEVRVFGGATVALPAAASAPAGQDLSLGVRPEDLVPAADAALFEGRIDLVEHLGEVQIVYLDIGLPDDARVIAKLPGDSDVARGMPLRLTAKAKDLHLFDPAGHALRSA